MARLCLGLVLVPYGGHRLDRAIPPSWIGLNDILFFIPPVPFCLKSTHRQ